MEIEKAYQESLDYLYSFVDYSLTRGRWFTPDKFNLTRMFQLLESLGNPHQGYPVIHVAGSKGKGSVAAMCASVLKSAGYRVGFYTSPHLHNYCERIQVNGRQIESSELIDLVEEVKPAVSLIPELTTFEITTALGFLYFARSKVNAAVIEVGLGGRLDATNVVMPVVSVITSISYDHMNVLGDTLEKIAFEKAGIIKPGVPVVVSPQDDAVYNVIKGVADERCSRYFQVGRDVLFNKQLMDDQQLPPDSQKIKMNLMGFSQSPDQVEIDLPNRNGQTLSVWSVKQPDQAESGSSGKDMQSLRITIPLLGSHQVENAATAYMALQVFGDSGYDISTDALLSGFREVYWPGRFEILQQSPALVIDSAHNRDSARRLGETLQEYFPGYGIILIFGVSEDKDVIGMFTELLPRVDRVIATRSFHPRAMDPEELARIANSFGKPIQVVDKVENALALAMATFTTDSMVASKKLVLATGSLFIAAAVRETWLLEHGQSVDRVYE